MAVLAVLAYHLTPDSSSFPSGFLGVDIFFALSGFLITSILLVDLEVRGSVDYRRFYRRRFFRLIPALAIAVILACATMAVRPPAGLETSVWLIVVAVLFYFGNWLVGLGAGSLGDLAHTWSLSVEEQFYLLWPATLMFLSRRRWFLRACLTAVPLIVVLRIGLAAKFGANIVQLTPLRADGLLLGAIVAMLVHRQDGRGPAAASPRFGGVVFAGLLLVLAALAVLPHPHTVAAVGGYSLVGALSAAFIAHVAAGGRSWACKFLATPLLVGVGRVSYGLYLYHYPLFALAGRLSWAAPARLAFALATTTVLTAASWFLVERPALRVAHRGRQIPGARTAVT